MRRSVAFLTRHKGEPNKSILRVFWMNDAQAKFFKRAVDALTGTDADPFKANEIVERVVVSYLEGKEPSIDAPKCLWLGRTLFPVLTDAEIMNLPRSGAPRGHIRALIFTLQVPTPGAKKPTMRTVRFDMAREQADTYNIALWGLQQKWKGTRDDAWFTLNGIVGRLLQGATTTAEADEHVLNLAAVFELTDLTACPLAGEDDVRRWAFTTDPQLVTP